MHRLRDIATHLDRRTFLNDASVGAPALLGRRSGIPVWSLAAACARPDGSFVILY